MTAIPPQIVTARRVAGGMLVLSALVTVVLVIVWAWWSAQPRSVVTAPVTGSGISAPPATAPAQPTAQPTAQLTAQPAVSPDVALQQQVDADRPQVEALVGYWVPQLSSKTVGLEADGIVYDDRAILDHVDSLKARYPQALLLRSDDYTSYEKGGYWVVVMPVTYPDGAGANSWCDAQGIDPDQCYAKLLQHSGGAAGTTLHRK